ncbi:MAG: Coenzyme A disulfide reductase [Lentisphaerae bacterium ADurb.BinA184]|nr:MAG: Coenzyme A disulfide reductase [Lentisphaerae bacterium ADurb.BinA184]
MKLVIVGGVAGGASAAARARRLDETAGIVMFERGEFISFANCGLPYHVGNVIKERSSLLVMTPERFRARTAIDVRTRHEVTAINRARHTVTVRNLENGQDSEEAYDKLILATGSSPVKPPIPGADDPDVMQLWTIPDMDRIKGRVDEGAKRALVVGGGFIGLEVAENLRERGLDVTLVEMLPSLLPTLDPEMARPLADGLRQHGVTVRLGRKVTRIRRPESETRVASRLTVSLDDGAELPADFVVLAVGVKPNSGLARQASLEIGERGGIRVNEFLQTSDADIYAVGDVNEVTDRVRRQPAQIPLAGPANRQGRVAADNALGARRVYRGTLGTNVVKVFELTAGSAGPGERRLREDGTAFHKVYLHPQSHAGYYPGAAMMSLKLLFAPDGKVLGVQAVGRDGVDKRIDVVATAIQAGMTVEDLADLELAYSPPYGSAKDPVNFAGMIAANVLRGDSRPVYAEELAPGDFLLDVREPEEYAAGHLEGATLIPLGKLRQRLNEIPRGRRVVAYCKVGLRGYLAERILRQNGFDAYNLSGGYLTGQACGVATAAATPPSPATPSSPPAQKPLTLAKKATPASALADPAVPAAVARQLDCSGMQCPGPLVQLRREVDLLQPGQVVKLRVTEPGFVNDATAWCQSTGHELVAVVPAGAALDVYVGKALAPAPATGAPAAGGAVKPSDAVTIAVFSGDLDRVMAAFILANGFASLGCKVSMFFTFWGLNVLRREDPPLLRKDRLSRLFGLMMPRGARKLALSKMHMLGMGTAMMKHVMAQKKVPSLPELISQARAQGVRFIACDMAMNVMGLTREELVDEVDEVTGVGTFAVLGRESGTVLFI